MPSILEINGSIPRTMDYAQIKAQEDSKAALAQQHTVEAMDKNQQEKATNVHEGANADNYLGNLNSDGHNRQGYEGDGGKNRKKKEQEPDGKVVLKRSGGFDLKI